MASANTLEPTEGKTRYLKWMLLLMEGGRMVLLDTFDAKVPPGRLAAHLNTPKVRNKLLKLHRDKKITDKQKTLLFPPSGQPDSSTFDITLLSCLLQNTCGLNDKSTAWSGILNPADVSLEADICRLRSVRNEVCHSGEMSMTEQTFQLSCHDLEQVLLRLGQNMPDLKTKIDDFKSGYIDKECETELLEKIQEWEDLDRVLRESINELKAEQKHQAETLVSATSKLSDLAYKANDQAHMMQDIDRRVSQNADIQKELGGITQSLTVGLDDVKAGQEKLQDELERVKAERIKKEQSMSSELRSLASMSKPHLEDAMKHQDMYVETRSHKKAKEILLQNNILVISGHPGEGKTTMALALASEISKPESFLRIRNPSDWCHVDLGLDLFDTFLIDDIYGAGVIDDELVKQWDRYLPDIQKAVQKRAIKVIIATRHYILEDAKGVMKKQLLFKEDNVIQLASKDLTETERSNILKKHLGKSERDIGGLFIDECLLLFEGFLELLLAMQTRDFVFGFPQCVEMFASNDSLFDRGAAFFSQPNEFFRDCIDDLSRDEEKFLALIMIWSRKGKPLLIEELDLSSTSHELTRVAKKFGFKLKPRLIRVLRKSLKHHEGGFVDYNSRIGSYSFSHNIIGDMVGLVIGKQYPEVTLEYITRDFLLAYLTTNDEKKNDFHFFIEEHLYAKLSNMLIKMLLNPHRMYTDDNVRRFRSGGNCPNTIIPTLQLDSSLVVCDAFDNVEFVNRLLDELQDNGNREQLETFLSTSVMKMSGHFLGMGLKLTETDITLPVYFLMNKQCLVMQEMIKRCMVNVVHDSLEIPLLIAVHGELKDFVAFLLDNGAQPTEEAKYIAALKENCDILKILMHKKGLPAQNSQKKCTIFNGSSALLAATKKGLVASVKCLVENGADINHRNTDGLNALDKAVLNEHLDICEILIQAGTPLNHRSGKFKRTPLHVAADMGLVDIVQLLLQHAASTAVKDHRGHYPIHCAAIRGFTAVVKSFLEHDMSLSKQRVISYGKKSVIKGMTVYHIAVWKENMELLNTLVEMNVNPDTTDIYGRTAFYCAVYDGKLDIVDKLMNFADMNKPEKQGFTPLHAALHRGHRTIAKSLCPLVDVNAQDKYGCTPLHVACEKLDTNMIDKLIKKHHVDVRIVTRRGVSAKRILARKGYTFELVILMNRLLP